MRVIHLVEDRSHSTDHVLFIVVRFHVELLVDLRAINGDSHPGLILPLTTIKQRR